MKIIKEVNSVSDFDFWSGAIYTINHLSDSQFETVIRILEDNYPEGMTDGELNDFFWFENDTIAEWLGFEDWEEFEQAI